jgi:hypothetical protein
MRLEASAIAEEDAEALATADMISESARPQNIWYGEDLHNADGELFEGYGSLNFASSRLDPFYTANSSRRARRRVKDSLARVRPQSGERLRMVTLTMPTIEAGFQKTMAVFDDARALLRKRQWFKDTFRGGVFGEEFTIGEAGDHYHVHCHVVAWSKWVVWLKLGVEWSACLQASAVKNKVEMVFTTEHGRAVVDVRLVTSKRRGKGTISEDDAIKEVAKYITKGSTYEELSPAQLIEVERTLRGRRMVETFGEANKRKGKSVEVASVEQVASLEERKDGNKSPNLDTQNTIDGSSTLAKAEKSRSESLRVVGARMISTGKRELWLEMLRYIYAERREWRKRQLAIRYPAAIFRGLDGSVWHGVEKMQALALSDRAEWHGKLVSPLETVLHA